MGRSIAEGRLTRTVRRLRAVDLTNVYRAVRDGEVGRLHHRVKGKG